MLWVVKGLGPGGAERLFVAAANAHDRGRFEIECAYVLPWKDHLVGELESAGVRTHCVSTKRTDRRWPLRLAKLVRSGDYDVVHVHSPRPASVARLATRFVRADRRSAVVSTERNRWETHRLPTRLLNRITSRWDDAPFAVTDEVRDSMRGPVGERAVTLRHGIDVERLAAARVHRDDVRAELGIADDEFVVVTAANFLPQKDYPNLLGAARLLAARNVAVRIVAIGQGRRTPRSGHHTDTRPGDVPHSLADNAALRVLFPDIDPVPLDDGLTATVDWMRTWLAARPDDQ